MLAQALQGGKQLIRPELVSVLKLAGIATDDLRRFTYALLDERAPQAKTVDRDEALAEVADATLRATALRPCKILCGGQD